MSNIKLTGRIATEPRIGFTPEGKEVANFRMSLYTGGTKEKGYTPSVFVGVTKWDVSEGDRMLKKGTVVTVTGQVQPPRSYKDRDTGAEKSAGLEITAKVIVIGDDFKPEVDEAF